MDDRLLRAAENNARWCDLVCRSHGIRAATSRGHWVALSRAPELYPDAVTLVPGLSAEDVLRSVQDGPGCSVKDSFADLDLSHLGFVELFAAQWLFRKPSAGSRSTRTLRWSAVATVQELAEWADAAGLAETIRVELLSERSVRFLGAHGRSGLCAGTIANRTGSVVGVSNVFNTTAAAADVWNEVADAIAAEFPSLPLVGYEHGEELEAAVAAGFTAIGPLRVWLRPVP